MGTVRREPIETAGRGVAVACALWHFRLGDRALDPWACGRRTARGQSWSPVLADSEAPPPLCFFGLGDRRWRRRPPLAAAGPQRKLRLLDIGCGTGRFLDFLKLAWPRLPTLGLDMSEPYVKYARRHLKRWSRLNLTVGNAETLPVPDESQDAVTSIFLFHELPPKVRRIVFRERARVLKPGGRLILVDSLQWRSARL